MLYSVNKIQAKLAINPEYHKQKTEIMQFFHINNMINNLGIQTIYMCDIHPPLFIEENAIKKICELATQNFGVVFDYNALYEGKNALLKISKQEPNIQKFKVTNNNELEGLVQLHYQHSTYGLKEQEKDLQKQEKKDKEAVLLAAQIEEKKKKEWEIFNKATNLKRDFVNSKIVSIDFEFYLKGKNNNSLNHVVTEVGISVSDCGFISTTHYLVEENYQMKKNKYLQNSFHFGDTKILKLEDIKKLLNKSLLNANYILFHEQREDFEILESLNINIPKNITVIDTQLCYKRYFRERGSLPNGEPLENLLTSFNVPYKDLHNAGNDAYYTLELLKSMQSNLLKTPALTEKSSLKKKM